MDTREYVGKHLAELELELDEDGSCLLEIDDERECVIVLLDGSETVLFGTNVAAVDELDRDGLYEHLLMMNFMDNATGGAALGLTPDGEVIALRLSVHATDIGNGDVERIVANLVDLAERLGRDLKDRRAAPGDGERAAPETATPTPSPDEPTVRPTKFA